MCVRIESINFFDTADIGRAVDALGSALSKTVSQVVQKTNSYFNHKKYSTAVNDFKNFIWQFTFPDNHSKFKSMKAQIKALKENNTYIEPETIYLRPREFKKGNKKSLIE